MKIVILTGAGISAESGIPTFRDSGGLWEGYKIEDVATPEAWQRNPALVQDFYNQRRDNVRSAKPNAAHKALERLEEKFNVIIITQNIDDLHERAGSTNIIHLHGEIMKSRSTFHLHLVYDLGHKNIAMGDMCEMGSQLRPHIVWFGESVPKMEEATIITMKADIFMVIGTSMVVYPAAGLLSYAPDAAKKYIIDPNITSELDLPNLHYIEKKATDGVVKLVEELMG
ncbi:MAG: NAD-dependent deacylase [Bacteroidetes bacterium]|nr:NAD-dependent deacylase [Bacteroidota bacterium]